jgi:hypothetical protein
MKSPKVGPVKPGIVKPGGPKGVAPGAMKPSMKMGGTSKNLKSIFKKK